MQGLPLHLGQLGIVMGYFSKAKRCRFTGFFHSGQQRHLSRGSRERVPICLSRHNRELTAPVTPLAATYWEDSGAERGAVVALGQA
jgi:hypothetical protein